MVQRLVYRRRHAWDNRSNKVKKVRTPGGKLTLHYTTKPANQPRCGDCKTTLNTLQAVRPKQLRTLTASDRRVSRAYGGSRCHTCVRQRIVRAFLIEEQKIVKAVLKQRKAAAAKGQ